MTIEDNKRRQIRESAERYQFGDEEMRRVIESSDFSIGRLVVQANRLAASPATSLVSRQDARNAEALLRLIENVDG